MSTGFSFVPARRRSPEAQGALEPAADGVDVGNGGCSDTAGCGGMLAGGIYLQASQALREGRKPPMEGEGRAQMAEALGVSMKERGAKRSGA